MFLLLPLLLTVILEQSFGTKYSALAERSYANAGKTE